MPLHYHSGPAIVLTGHKLTDTHMHFKSESVWIQTSHSKHTHTSAERRNEKATPPRLKWATLVDNLASRLHLNSSWPWHYCTSIWVQAYTSSLQQLMVHAWKMLPKTRARAFLMNRKEEFHGYMTEWSCVFCSKVKWNASLHTPFTEPLLLTQDCLIYRPQSPATVYTDAPPPLYIYMRSTYRGYI